MALHRHRKRDAEDELGFGTKVTERNTRFIHPDGSFNIHRKEVSRWDSLSVYHHLISMPWRKFNLTIILYFIVMNAIFASLYYLIGLENMHGSKSTTPLGQFFDGFYFSAQTLTTVGYGGLSPGNHLMNAVAAVEALFGVLGFALITGLLYGRFSRPTAKIMFSKSAIIAPFREGTAFQFRLANQLRNSQLIEVECKVNVSLLEEDNGKKVRKFRPMELEVKKINFFPMSWTINHIITDTSPLYGMSDKDLEEADAEFMILITGFDDTFSQTVNARYSYKYFETVYGARFTSVFSQDEQGRTIQDLNLLSVFEPAELPVLVADLQST
ncbi:MAG TPA: ion channel [Bacteroidia bacterium]|jgi:inward rectifier potassium channel|nr:ion channel [Bacteroidia bacterium]